MAAGDLTTIESAQAWAGPDVNAALITAASSQIEAWLGYKLASQSYTRSFSSSGGSVLFVPDRPLTAVASLTIGGTAVPASAGADQLGYVFDDKAISLIGGSFGRGVKNVRATYTAGYAQIPPDLEQACLVLIKSVMDRAARESDVVSLRAGDTAYTYNRQNKTDVVGLLPTDVIALLSAYRRVSPC